MSESRRSEILSPGDTLRGYDRWSAHYDGGDNPMIAATAWALDARPLELAGARVLELGCGTGRNAARVLAGGAAAYVGVDGSDGMLAIARARAGAGDPRCTWLHADVLATAPLPIAAGGFDLALVVLVLEHVRDLAPPFAAIARALRPGGVLRVVEIHPDLVGAGTVAHFHDAAAGGGEVRFTSVAHPVASITRALAEAGLVVERADEDTAAGALLAAAPRLAKHRDRRVLLDLSARWAPRGA
jgi:SAM-dependent methyltransferase